MNFEQYTNERNTMYNNAQAFIDSGDIDGANAEMQRITDLDARYEAASVAAANLAALNNAPVVSAGVAVGIVGTENTGAPEVKDMYTVAFAKSLMGAQLSAEEKNAIADYNAIHMPRDAANTKKDNELLIPEQTAANIWKVAEAQHALYGDIARTFVNADLVIIKEDGSATDGEWLDETDSMTDGTVGFGSMKLTGCELAKCIPVSWSLKEQSIDSFMAYIVDLIGRKMGGALAKAEAVGKGKADESKTWKDQPRGIITALNAESGTPQVVTYAKGGAMDYGNFTSAFAKIASGYARVIYASSKTIWENIANIKDANKRPMFISDVTGGGVGRIFGAVVKAEDAIPDGTVLIGDARQGYRENIKKNMTIMTEDHVKGRYTDYAAYAIVDGDVLDTKAFAYIAEAAQ